MSENKNMFYIEKYKDLYKANLNKTISINSFSKMMKFLEENNGILLTPYTSIEDDVTINIFGGNITVKQSNLKKSIQLIINGINTITQNGDTFCNIVDSNPRVKYRFISIDGKMFEKSMSEYKKYIQGRTVFFELLKSNGHKSMSPYINNHNKILIDFNCNIHNPSYKSPCEYKISQKCQQCSHRVVTIGINDIATTRPDLVKYFKNTKDAHKYSKGSNDKTWFKCPICNTEKYDTISNISCFGFSCSSCSDGISYPEKFMYNILNSVKEYFIYQYQPDWIVPKRYDFYLKNHNIIIEMDGGLGHGNNSIDKSANESLLLDITKDHKAEEHGLKVIRIDCNYGSIKNRRNYIENSIKNSELCDYIDLSKVDFQSIDVKSNNSYVKQIWDMYASGYSSRQISKKIPLSVTSICQHLKNGNKLGIVKYDHEKSNYLRNKGILNSTCKPCKIIDIETNEVYYFCSLNKCRKEMKISTVDKHAKNNTLYKDKYKISYISKYDFNNAKSQYSLNVYGDFFNVN